MSELENGLNARVFNGRALFPEEEVDHFCELLGKSLCKAIGVSPDKLIKCPNPDCTETHTIISVLTDHMRDLSVRVFTRGVREGVRIMIEAVDSALLEIGPSAPGAPADGETLQ